MPGKKKNKDMGNLVKSMRLDISDIYGLIFNSPTDIDLRGFINNKLKKYGSIWEARETVLLAVLVDVSSLIADLNNILDMKQVTLH